MSCPDLNVALFLVKCKTGFLTGTKFILNNQKKIQTLLFYQAIIGYIRRGFLHANGNTLAVAGKQTVITKAIKDQTHILTALMSE